MSKGDLSGSVSRAHCVEVRKVLKERPPRRRRPKADDVLKPPVTPDSQAAKSAYEKARPEAEPILKTAANLLSADKSNRIPKETRAAHDKAQFVLDAAVRQENYPVALELLPKYERAAQAVVDVDKGMKLAESLKKKQVEGQVASYDEMAPVMKSVKKGLFPDGQAANIERQDYSAGVGSDHFKSYLSALKTLEASKKGVNLDQPIPPEKGRELKTNCQELIAKAEAYLLNFEKNLNDKQKKDKASLSMKRYCEEGKLAAFQYMITLDFDSVGQPTLDKPWDDETQMRAASVNAKIKFHQAYEQATSLKETGGSGASASLWIAGGDIDETGQVQTKKRTAIFKPFMGESAPSGSTDKPGAGAAKEALACANAKLFAAQTGIDLGVPETSVVSVNRYAIKGGMQEKGAKSTTEEVVGSVQQNAGATDEVAELPFSALNKIKPAEVQKIALLDIMSLTVDRHAGNLMANLDDQGNPQLVPIDHGGTLPSRKDFAAVKERMAGMSIGGFSATVFNKLLLLPASYEPFDSEIAAQLDLLKPEEIEAGMKRQRDAMDKVHPSLGAGTKVGDDSFHMSKRAMMFTKKAAKVMSPAEIQIALGVHGEELFDAADSEIDALIEQVITEAAPKKQAYLEIFSYPETERTAFATWLRDNKWVLATESNAGDASAFIMKNPELALQLYKSKTPNAKPVQPERLPKATAPDAGSDQQAPKPDDATQKLMFAAFPKLKESNEKKPFDDKAWQDYAYYWNQIQSSGGMAEYKAALKATGAKGDEKMSDTATALLLWSKLKDPAYAAVLKQLPPNSDEPAVALFTRLLKKSMNKELADKQLAGAKTAAATIDSAEALRSSTNETLKKIQADLDGWPPETAFDPSFDFRLDTVKEQTQNGDPTATEAAARSLHRDIVQAMLDAIAAKGKEIAQSLDNILPNIPAVDRTAFAKQLGDLLTFCFKEASVENAISELEALRKAAATIRENPQGGSQTTDAAVELPKFSWDPDVPSAVKKQAVAAGLFKKDKDTGMSDAIKPVHSARKALQAMLDKDPPASNEKKRAAMDEALAAYSKFLKFVDGKLRLLSIDPVWGKYCDSAAELAKKEIQDGGDLLKTWK